MAQHRQIVGRHWTFRQKRKPRRPRVDPETGELVLRTAWENVRWGYTKIAGEVRKLGLTNTGRTTVERILKRHGLAPRLRPGGLSWADFLGRYGQVAWACAFSTAPPRPQRRCGPTMCSPSEMRTRRIVFWSVAERPDGAWVAPQFRNPSIVVDALPRYLIHDRDGEFAAHSHELPRALATKPVRLPARSPDLKARAVRWPTSHADQFWDLTTSTASRGASASRSGTTSSSGPAARRVRRRESGRCGPMPPPTCGAT